MSQTTVLLLFLIVFLSSLQECCSLAGRGQRRRTKVSPAIEYNSATATTLDDTDHRDLEILWSMAGQTSRRKQQSGRKCSQLLREDSNRKREEPLIGDEEIESVTIDTPQQVTVALKNGTVFSTNPQDYHQRRDFHIWMRTRQQLDVTASELSALVNNSYFSTREQLIKKKAGLVKSSFVSNSKACQWGIKMEPLALKQYRQVTNHQVQETGLWIHQHDNQLFVGASPDGIVYDATTNSTGVLEIKSLWGRRHNKELPQFEHCPTRFWDQIQGQLAVCNVEWCDLMLFIPPRHRHARNYCILRVERNQTYWDQTMLPAIQQFCQEVTNLKQRRDLPTEMEKQ